MKEIRFFAKKGFEYPASVGHIMDRGWAHYMDSSDKWPDEDSVLAEAARIAAQVQEIGKLSIHQELVTRLYNLVNDAETAVAFLIENTPDKARFTRTEDYQEACEEHGSAYRTLEFRITEARETLNKVTPK